MKQLNILITLRKWITLRFSLHFLWTFVTLTIRKFLKTGKNWKIIRLFIFLFVLFGVLRIIVKTYEKIPVEIEIKIYFELLWIKKIFRRICNFFKGLKLHPYSWKCISLSLSLSRGTLDSRCRWAKGNWLGKML